MPIKFKCSCGQVLSVPDKMAGKQGKCPKCKNALKVPVPKKKSTQAGQAAKKPAAAPAAAAAPNMLDSLFEDAGLTERKGPVCPQCAEDIKPGTVLCTHCGFNLESGETLKGFDAKVDGPEFQNEYLQEAADNMRRDLVMEDRREKAEWPWWLMMSFLIGAVTLCAAGVIIVDGFVGAKSPENTLMGKIQRWPVFTTLGLTAGITGVAITVFAHMSICFYAFTKSVGQGIACFFLPLAYSVVFGILNWKNNRAPVIAIIWALAFIGLGTFLIVQGGGFQLVINAFR